MDPSFNDASHATKVAPRKPLERTKLSKIMDCIIIVIIGIASAILEFQPIKVNPNNQYIPGLENTTSSNYNFAYPNTQETVSNDELSAICLLPWYILLIVSTIALYFIDKQFSFAHWKTHFYLMNRMIIFQLVVTLLITDIIKLFIGSPRPYFLSVYNDPLSERSDLVSVRLSFPSGHASLSMASAFLLTVMLFKSWNYVQNMYYNQSYIIGMKTNNPHSYYLCGLWWLTREVPLIAISIVFAPMYYGMWCGLTRIRDYKHFAADVLGGMVIGACVGYVTFLIFYNEMYVGFEYRLNEEIQEMRNESKRRGNKYENEVPLQEISAQ